MKVGWRNPYYGMFTPDPYAPCFAYTKPGRIMTEAEKELIEAALEDHGLGPKHEEYCAICRAAAKVREERQPKPRWVAHEQGIRDTKTGSYFDLSGATMRARDEVLTALNATER